MSSSGDWQHTYHKIPKLVDNILSEQGADRLAARGAADANDGALFDVFDTWRDEQLWPAIAKAYGDQIGTSKAPDVDGLDIQISVETRTSLLRQDLQKALVLETGLLTASEAPQKRHMEIQLPSGMSYRAGDYLAVLPFNPLRNVRRAIARFRLPWDAMITITEMSHTSLPKGKPLALFEVLSALVELSQPATSRQVKKVAETLAEPTLKAELERLAGDGFQAEVIDKNNSLLDILERYPTAQLSLGQFLDALPAMRIRQYSISSSPLKDPSRCTITYTVLDAPMRAAGANEKGRFLGVSSNYLRSCEPGDWIHVAVRPSHAGFHLPLDEKTPILMVCAGTGLAPFRAFVQERALKIESGKQLAPDLLFYGCSSPGQDELYAEEFAKWQQQGAVDLRLAYSRQSDRSLGCRHVQDRIWHDREDAKKLFAQNAQVYLCGAGVVGAEINKVMVRIYMESKKTSQGEADEWVAKLKGVRYWTDVFA
jgi:cytochrome P450/NADPH-cytochrome P450 reductase